MRPAELTKDIFWIGVVSHNKRNFHGYSRSPRDTICNSYLVRDEKNAIFDTVDNDHAGTMFCRFAKLIPLDRADYIVVNHTKEDYAGILCQLIEHYKPEKIIMPIIGRRFMEAQFDTTGWSIEVVKTGDIINIGEWNIHSAKVRMLHWPDSMVSYIPEDKPLISSDAFGQNIISSGRFSDQYDRCVLGKTIREYCYNIIPPFSPQAFKTPESVTALRLDTEMIAPDRGPIQRGKDDCECIFDTYHAFAEQKPRQRAVIVYDSMWGSIGIMAPVIASGLGDGGAPVRIIDIQKNYYSDVMTELAGCGTVIVGPAMHNNNILPGIADVLTYIKGLRLLNHVSVAFGFYGWSGEPPKVTQEQLAFMNMGMSVDPVRRLFVPKHEGLSQCVVLDKTVAEALKTKCWCSGEKPSGFPPPPVPAAKVTRGTSRGSVCEQEETGSD